jgi:hypothetical protein
VSGRYQVVIPTDAPTWGQQLQAPFNSVFQRIDLDIRSPRRLIQYGTVDSPATDGPDAIDSVIRVDQSVGAEDPSFLLHVRYTGLKRLAGGAGWIQANKTVVEDYSPSAASQSVAVAGVMYKYGQGAGWGIYSECHGIGANSVPVSAEMNVSNYSGSDYTYDEALPSSEPCSKGIWVVGFGTYSNSFALGIIAGEATATFGCGIYLGAGSITDYGIDIQSTPTTGIRFKYGAAGGAGVGIDFGEGASYGSGNEQGCMNIWSHAIRFGDGTGYIAFNVGTGLLEFGYGGSLRRTLDMSGAYVAL